ncbi:uncharacterized protein F4822DRAFT_431693 [Hypoxylon trugodes]|uniref:uncharacterized protein n=1 Tax=Hypoxylon trugodes TaxID=326681 RepID=UPI00219BF173|nr:uncharacterized protein F4822DRAFT_431693 [Hypoxylon trugodes]KAI1386825.1 hypothetical protein F4822DRAFT_431693 [Hypoxylon trugodes]
MDEVEVRANLPTQNTSHENGNGVFRFFDLPLELRNEVYSYLLVQPKPVQVVRLYFTTTWRKLQRLKEEGAPDCCGKNYICAHYDAKLRPYTNILRACKQASEEALDILYGRNTFRMVLESREKFRRLFAVGERNLRRVRYLKIVAVTTYWMYQVISLDEERYFFRPAAEDAVSWSALVGGLASLECVLKLPISNSRYGWLKWVGQLETVIGFIGEHVDEETEVIVDDNYSIFLCEAVDRSFIKGFERVKTAEGDSYYWKTRFDPENVTGPVASDEAAQCWFE